MDIEPTNDVVTVSPDTDDLDAFNDLLKGRAQEATVEANEDTDTVADDDQTHSQDDVDNDVDEAPDGDDSDSTEDDDDKPAEKPKKVNRYQERINELTAKAREAERALEALRQESQKQSEAPKAPVTNDVDEQAPDVRALNEDGSDKYPLGEFDPNYIRDLTRHTIKVERTEAQKREAQELAQRQNQEARDYLQEQWQGRLATVTEQHDDFIDKTLQLETAFDGLDPQYSDYLVQTIKSLDHGPEVLYYFANHLDEANKFVKMGPLQATLALGEINAQFKGNTRKETKVSSAPVPPQVNKGSATRTTVAADTDDLDAFSDIFFAKKKKR
jgi:hypothetical protein